MVVLIWWLALWFQRAEALEFQNRVHDFGTLREQAGTVTHTFTFTNRAGRPVRIISVQAACGCTTPAWSDQPVQPGKSGFVRTTFDPTGRPGYFQKTITVNTDLPAPHTTVILTLTGNVSSGPTPVSELAVQRGALRFRTEAFNMGTVHNNRPPASKEFEVLNAGAGAVHFTGAESPSHIRVLHPEVLQAGQRGLITVLYDGKKKNGYGFFAERITLLTDQPDEPRLDIALYATLEEFFAELSDEEKARAPRLVLNPVEADMGVISRQQTKEVTVQLKNAGKKDLHIRAWQTNCDCVEARAETTVIKPQAVAPFTVRWTGEGRSGTQLKAITIYSGDPVNPVQKLVLTGVVEE
jgi:hypothetical protein